MSNTRSCEDVIKENITPADFGIAESEHQKAIYFAEYMLHRCVVNMQAEIERLKEKTRLSEAECRKALDDRRQAFAMRDELRAKLKALEEQKPVAWKDTCTEDDGHGNVTKTPVLLGYEGWESLSDATDLYLAAGAKHD